MSARPDDEALGFAAAPGQPPIVDDGSVRVTVAFRAGQDEQPAVVVSPPQAPREAQAPVPGSPGRSFVDGEPAVAALERLDETHAVLVQGEEGAVNRTNVLLGAVRAGQTPGVQLRAVVVDGWLVEVEIESARRAALRDRARRGANVAGHGGPVEIRAIIPGRVVAVSVAPGDSVAAGQQVLVVEAMKMQNELRAPREGTVARIGVAIGDTIDVGDLLVVIH